MKTHRRHLYVCGYHHERGSAVCPNGVPMLMDAADTAVLAAIERDVMREAVVEAALREALEMLRPTESVHANGRRKALQAELFEVERQLGRYAEAIAQSGPLNSLLVEIERRETRRAELKQQLAAVRGESVTSIDVPKLMANLRARLTDWQAMLKREKAEARQLLRELLVGRLVFEPKEDENGRYYTFRGRGSISPILRGAVVRSTVNPAGVTKSWGEMLSPTRARIAPSLVNS